MTRFARLHDRLRAPATDAEWLLADALLASVRRFGAAIIVAAGPWLVSVDDEYDDVSPRHRWTTRLSMSSASKKLGSLVKGHFRGIRVLRPRICV